MSRPKWVQLSFFTLAGIAAAAAACFHTPISSERESLDAAVGQSVDAGKFPELTLLQAMPGGMRAIAVDALWMRSQDLKQEGRFYDATQVAALICKLQPRFPQVWVFHAWNLAYNISVATQTPQERWKWISDSIQLLRDEGIPYNPNALDLYQELGYIYLNKVAGTADDMHLYYKRYLAGEYQRLLGAPPHSGKPEEMAAWLGAIKDAPATRDALLADNAVADYVSQLASVDVKLDMGLLDAYETWSKDPLVHMIGQPIPTAGNDAQKALQRLMTDDQLKAARDRTVAFVRRQLLISQYRLDPAWMLELTRKYGPLDWRTPYAHALYWSTYGLEHCKGYSSDAINSMNTDRVVLNSLRDLTVWGELSLTYNPSDPMLPEILRLPEWRYIDAAHKEQLKIVERDALDPNSNPERFRAGHVNYLIEAINVLWLAGQDAKAQELLDFIRSEYKLPDPQWKLPLDDFVIYTMNAEGMPRHQVMLQALAGLTRRAYLSLVNGDDADAAAAMARANLFWQKYQQDPSIPDRMRVSSFQQIQIGVSGVLISELPLLAGSTLYRNLPTEVQAETFDWFAPAATQRCKDEGLDFAKLFPEPPSLQAVRERREKAKAPEDKTITAG